MVYDLEKIEWKEFCVEWHIRGSARLVLRRGGETVFSLLLDVDQADQLRKGLRQHENRNTARVDYPIRNRRTRTW